MRIKVFKPGDGGEKREPIWGWIAISAMPSDGRDKTDFEALASHVWRDRSKVEERYRPEYGWEIFRVVIEV